MSRAVSNSLMRLFVAIDLDDDIRGRLGKFVEQVRPFAPDVRWISASSFHVTLKFIGGWKPERLDEVKSVLAAVQSPSFSLNISDHGFFPEKKSARVFFAGIQTSHNLVALARQVDSRLALLGIRAERGLYHPHITLARYGSGSPKRQAGDGKNGRFRNLQTKLSTLAPLEFGEQPVTEFCVFESRLSSQGSSYRKLESFPLRPS